MSAEQLTRNREYDSPHVELFVSFFVRARNKKTWSVIVQTEIFEGVLNAVWHPSLKLVIQIDNNSIFVHYTNKRVVIKNNKAANYLLVYVLSFENLFIRRSNTFEFERACP